MGKTPVKARSGMTLIEVMIAAVVVIVGVLGAMMYRYHSAVDARKADIQMGAGRVALLIMEGWKGASGAEDFDPSNDIGLEVLNSADISISSGSGGIYPVSLTGGTDCFYHAKLIFDNDIDGDGTDDYGIRKLDVHVAWRQSALSGTPSADDWASRSVKLSSYRIAH